MLEYVEAFLIDVDKIADDTEEIQILSKNSRKIRTLILRNFQMMTC